MQLSEHFTLEEFRKNDPIPVECIPAFETLAKEIMEPVRVKFNVPLVITSGYRSPDANAAAKGQSNSEHIATATVCACDFYPGGIPGVLTARDVFNWMRANYTLPYHQLILEHGKNGSSVIHVSYNAAKVGLRSVLEGATHNAEPYVKVDHVEYSV